MGFELDPRVVAMNASPAAATALVLPISLEALRMRPG